MHLSLFPDGRGSGSSGYIILHHAFLAMVNYTFKLGADINPLLLKLLLLGALS